MLSVLVIAVFEKNFSTGARRCRWVSGEILAKDEPSRSNLPTAAASFSRLLPLDAYIS
jgi:hypothetical protein